MQRHARKADDGCDLIRVDELLGIAERQLIRFRGKGLRNQGKAAGYDGVFLREGNGNHQDQGQDVAQGNQDEEDVQGDLPSFLLFCTECSE